MVSEKQLEANKENAKLGGVKTEAGKETSKYNAQTHGILRNAITDYESEYYAGIYEELENHYKPVSILERILVERITIQYLKLFRVQKAENEYVASVLDPHIEDDDYLFTSLNRTIVKEGYIPKVKYEDVEKMYNIYSRYETSIENKFYRAIHELERIQRTRSGEHVCPPFVADINEMGSFGKGGIS